MILLVLSRDLIGVWLIDEFIKKNQLKSHLYVNLTTLGVLKKLLKHSSAKHLFKLFLIPFMSKKKHLLFGYHTGKS